MMDILLPRRTAHKTAPLQHDPHTPASPRGLGCTASLAEQGVHAAPKPHVRPAAGASDGRISGAPIVAVRTGRIDAVGDEVIDKLEARHLFGEDVAGYEEGRPQYPVAVYDILRERCGLRAGSKVLEIGPGTGRVTRICLEAGAMVVAVEPDDAMADHLTGQLPNVELVRSTFELAPLPAGAFDLVVAAMSFHWVDQGVGVPKLAEILAPGGWVALWWTLWSDPDRPGPFAEVADELLRAPGSAANTAGRPQFELDAEARINDLESLGRLVEVNVDRIPWSVGMDAQAVRRHSASMISVRRRPEHDRQAVLDTVERIVVEQFGGHVQRNFLTVCYTWSFALS